MHDDPDTNAHPFKGDPPELDQDLIERVVGKRILIGLTHVTAGGSLIKQEQFHGVVEEISLKAGIAIRLPDGSL